jgi:hypothetical protein
MLVYLKEPMGYTQVDGYRVYGRRYCYGKFGSTDIPKEVFDKYKDILEHAEYTKVWLENKFGGTFPDITFKLSELSKLSPRQLIQLNNAIGNTTVKRKNLTIQDRNALRRALLNHLR